jgi:hypothetical protein
MDCRFRVPASNGRNQTVSSIGMFASFARVVEGVESSRLTPHYMPRVNAPARCHTSKLLLA